MTTRTIEHTVASSIRISYVIFLLLVHVVGAVAQSTRTDMALQSMGGWIVTSSIANIEDLYSDNLNDGNSESRWQSAGLRNEEFIEIAWDMPHQVDTITLTGLHAARDDTPQTVTARMQAQIDDQWQDTSAPKATVTADMATVTLQCDVVATSRVRILLTTSEPVSMSAATASAFGPDQPLVVVRNVGPWLQWQWQYEYLGRSSSSGGPDPAPPFRMTVLDVHCPTGPIKPGDDIDITISLRPDTSLPYNAALMLTVGEREMVFDYTDYTIIRMPVLPSERPSSWTTGVEKTITVPVHIPVYAPHDTLPIMLHIARPPSTAQVTLCNAQGDELPDNIAGHISIERFAQGLPEDNQAHQVTVDGTGTGTALSIDGVRATPIMAAMLNTTYRRLHYYSQQAGIKIFQVHVYPFKIYDGDYQQRNFEYVSQKIDALRRIDPQAYVLLAMDLRTSGDWQSAHPDELLYTHDGTRKHESFASAVYRNEVKDYLTNLVNHVHSQPWCNRVIGYLCMLGEPEGTLSGAPDVGDYNPQAIEAFRDFVRDRYNNDPATLQDAYNDPDITFETVYPHHDQIVATGENGGVFLNPATQQMPIDYHEFLASMIPTFLRDVCAATIKQLTDNRVLVGSYWAYMTHNLTYSTAGSAHQLSHSYLPHIVNSNMLDFYSCPFYYDLRRGGDPYRPFQTFDAVRTAGKLSIAEMDNRTYRHGAKVNYRLLSVQETIGVMRMNMATCIMHGMGGWLADWTTNTGDNRRLSEPAFLDDIQLDQANRMRSLYADTLDVPRHPSAEVAVLLSGPSYFYHDNYASAFYGESIRQMLYSQITHTGVPCDELLLEDIERTEVRDHYKCYLFINAFHLTRAQRQSIDAIKASGRTVVFMYAPGYVTDDDLSLANLRSLVGMAVDVHHPRRNLMDYTITDTQHPITKGVTSAGPYTVSWGGMRPYFTIPNQSSATILGRYVEDNAGALAVRNDTPNVIYCAASYMPADLLRGIFRYAGCHVYADAPIYMDATDNFLLLTNDIEENQTVRITLPGPRKVVNTYNDKVFVDRVSRFAIQMKPFQTLLYSIHEPSPSETLLHDTFNMP